MKDEFDGFIGYGEGIRNEEDWGVFTGFGEGIFKDERPDL